MKSWKNILENYYCNELYKIIKQQDRGMFISVMLILLKEGIIIYPMFNGQFRYATNDSKMMQLIKEFKSLRSDTSLNHVLIVLLGVHIFLLLFLILSIIDYIIFTRSQSHKSNSQNNNNTSNAAKSQSSLSIYFLQPFTVVASCLFQIYTPFIAMLSIQLAIQSSSEPIKILNIILAFFISILKFF